MGDRAEREAFVTLATNDTYALGCLVLGNSLRRTNTERKLVVMVTDGVTPSMRNQLSRVFDLIYQVDLLDSRDSANLALLGRPDLSCTFTKLHCWRLTQFDKAVFLDADTLVLQCVDELFDREELSASPDAGWPDCFNSGVFVYKPCEETYNALRDFALSHGSFDGGDQGLLNLFFRDWATKDIARHLPFIYNVVSQAFYSYLPAFTEFKNNIKIVHFIGEVKPWHHAYNTTTGRVQLLPQSGHNQDFLQLWWNIFMSNVQAALDPALTPFFRIEFTSAPPSPNIQHGSMVEANRNSSSSYHILYPYVPPCLDIVSYTPTSVEPSFNLLQSTSSDCHTSESENIYSPHHSPSEMSQVIEITDLPKPYLLYETHYPEEPLSNINPDAPPQSHYEACDLDEVLKPQVEEESVVISEDIDNSRHVIVDEDMSASKDISSKDIIDKIMSASDIHLLGGLVGELASLQIRSGGPSLVFVDDTDRKLAWERGQMDYMGIDSFDNIKRKLDSKITERSPSPSRPDNSSSPTAAVSNENTDSGVTAVKTNETTVTPSATQPQQ